MQIRINQNHFNEIYFPLLDNDSRYLILYGGAGSGKSYFAAQKTIIRTLKDTRSRILVLRKVARTLRSSAFLQIKDIISDWGLSDLFSINEMEMKITCINKNQILFTGLDDPEKLKSIAGITSEWIEETTELTEEDFTQSDLRMRGKTETYKQIIMTFNPISSMHWIKKRFFDTSNEAHILKTTYLDNRFLDSDYVEVLKNLETQNPDMYKIYTQGEWGTLTELIYNNWDVIDTSGIDFDEIIAGVDFGYNNPSVYLTIGIKDKEVYILNEIYQSHLKNSDLIEFVKQQPKASIIYPDTAEPDRIEEFQEAGFSMGETSKDILQGINFVKTLKIHIDPKCVNTIKEIEGYSYRKDKDGNVLEEPVKFNDHAMDAMRYALYSHLKNSGSFLIG